MAVQEKLDLTVLPENLRDELDLIDQLEGRYRITSYLQDAVADMNNLAPRKSPPCHQTRHDLAEKLEREKPVMVVKKVNPGSKMYKMGIRWTSCIAIRDIHKAELTCMVLFNY